MKKIMSFILVMVMVFALPVTSLASNNETVVDTVYMNEYDYIVFLQKATQEELVTMGLSRTVKGAIVAFIDEIEVPGRYRVFIENSGQSTETIIGHIAVKKR